MQNNINRTPFHELGAGTPRVPAWVAHRSVYRGDAGTLYLVETDSIDSARRDLATLKRRGWNVQIDRAAGHAASIALSRKAA